MRRSLLLATLLSTLTATAQFRLNDNAQNQIGIRTGLSYWYSNFKGSKLGFGPDEDFFFRQEKRHWAIELGFNYSTLQHPINYNTTDIQGNSLTYDRFSLNSYALIISLQRTLTSNNNLRTFVGIYVNPVYYHYNIHQSAGFGDGNLNGGGPKMGIGINYTLDYSLTNRLWLNGTFRAGYLKQRDEGIDNLYNVPEFKFGLLFGMSYRL